MSFTAMRRDDLYELATNNFAVDVKETATKPQIIAALAEEGVTWEMAQTFDKNAQAVVEVLDPTPPAGVITAASTKPTPEKIEDVVLEVEPPAEVNPAIDHDLVEPLEMVDFIKVPKDIDGFVKDNVFTPFESESPVVLEDITTTTNRLPFAQHDGDVVLLKMERDNPRYDIRGYSFTQQNPFALVKDRDADFILSHNDGFKVASPREAKEFYG